MELKKLLDGVEIVDFNVDMSLDVNEIKINSAEVKAGDMFVCMKGTNDDATRYVKDITVPFVAVSEKKLDGASYVQVKDARLAYSKICNNRFLHPLDDVKLVSVIGTNGKTSTASYICQILTYAGIKCGLIGTSGHFIDGEKVGQSLTTPDPYEFFELLFKMRAKGCEVVVSELSAHAIYWKKLAAVKSDFAVFTNLSQDHLDFFKTYEEYKRVKVGYFSPENAKCAIVNVDDPAGREILKRAEESKMHVIAYGLENPADCFAVKVREGMDGISFVANFKDEIMEIRSRLFGEFNVYNLLSAITVAAAMGVECRTIEKAALKVRAVKGRFSILRSDKGTIIIDFAHTPEGLKNVLSAARTLTKSRLITVFGCGGERDALKRRIMGEVASKYSDSIVLTSDNPRGEEPEEIIKQIEQGVCIKDVKCIPERSDAIRYAISGMDEGDTLVIAGKGDENYLEVSGKKIPYSDFDVVSRYVK